jgi:ankyrin repeat protein
VNQSLIQAIQDGNIDLAVVLIDEGGANVNHGDYELSLLTLETGNTAIHYAAMSRYREDINLVKMLLERGANPNIRNWFWQSPLHTAILENFKPPRSLDRLKCLLDNGAYVEVRDRFGHKPIHDACNHLYPDPKLVKLLIDHGADVNTTTRDKESALHFSCDFRIHRENPNVEVVELLLKHGANVNAIDKNGKTPLFLAKSNGYVEVVKLLEKYEALDER